MGRNSRSNCAVALSSGRRRKPTTSASAKSCAARKDTTFSISAPPLAGEPPGHALEHPQLSALHVDLPQGRSDDRAAEEGVESAQRHARRAAPAGGPPPAAKWTPGNLERGLAIRRRRCRRRWRERTRDVSARHRARPGRQAKTEAAPTPAGVTLLKTRHKPPAGACRLACTPHCHRKPPTKPRRANGRQSRRRVLWPMGGRWRFVRPRRMSE